MMIPTAITNDVAASDRFLEALKHGFSCVRKVGGAGVLGSEETRRGGREPPGLAPRGRAVTGRTIGDSIVTIASRGYVRGIASTARCAMPQMTGL